MAATTKTRRPRGAETPPRPPFFHAETDERGRMRTFNLREAATWIGISTTQLLGILKGERQPGERTSERLKLAKIRWRTISNGYKKANKSL